VADGRSGAVARRALTGGRRPAL